MSSPDQQPRSVRPTPGGIYDYLLGGHHYSAADREAAEGCVFLKGVNLRLFLGESSVCGSVCVFRGVLGVTWSDRCWSAWVLAGLPGKCRGWCRVPGPPVPGPVPGSWGGINPHDPRRQVTEDRRWRFAFR